jgi:hypothetical protein
MDEMFKTLVYLTSLFLGNKIRLSSFLYDKPVFFRIVDVHNYSWGLTNTAIC